MLTEAEFRALLAQLGEPIEFRQTKPPAATVSVRAIVQPPNKGDDALINAYGTNSRSIQIAARDLPFEPVKFDVVVVGGEHWTLDTVQSQHQRQTGTVTYWLCYAKGR